MARYSPVEPTGTHHLRLTVTDIARSKAFYQQLLDSDVTFDFSERGEQPGVNDDPAQLFGGCGFTIGNQLLGLRPTGPADDSAGPKRIGLNHVSLRLGSLDALRAADQRLTDAGIEHGRLTEMNDVGMAVVSVQDPDDTNVELMVPIASRLVA
jgi:glyoxylase I family protein